jgi:hypothetical protein
MSVMKTRGIGDIIIVDVGLKKVETSTQVDEMFVKPGHGKFLLNLAGVKIFEPAAIRQLQVHCHLAETIAGEVRLENVNNIKDPRTLTQLALTCPIHDDEAEAISNFRKTALRSTSKLATGEAGGFYLVRYAD